VIETERLFIRPLVPDDAEEVHMVWGDPANERFGGDWPTPETAAHTRSYLERGSAWGVWERATDAFVGDCGLFFAEEHGEWELAYGFRRDRRGRGYATEAARACVRHGFEELGLEKIVADVDPANTASVRVLEHCGFVRIGGAGDKLLYAVTRETSR
jgi:RimJ/RimL family protein N-acetyltransferase